MKKRNIKMIICFAIILIVFSFGLIMLGIQLKYYEYYTTYCEDYYSVLAKTEIWGYNQIMHVNGEPAKTVRERYTDHGDYFIYNVYDDGRLFVFSDNENTSGHPYLYRIELTNPEYRFGRKEIGVGTDKSTIEKVYRKSYRELQQDSHGKYFVEDGRSVLVFYFDENDIVYKIAVARADIIHDAHGWKKK
ncbi:MAG: hypothetical protein HDR12_04595 [Lachnospiraceae bacterium]|nr:hypothetical protein [Lachnospiraceae bacterium]